jgi:hypothetical protein
MTSTERSACSNSKGTVTPTRPISVRYLPDFRPISVRSLSDFTVTCRLFRIRTRRNQALAYPALIRPPPAVLDPFPCRPPARQRLVNLDAILGRAVRSWESVHLPNGARPQGARAGSRHSRVGRTGEAGAILGVGRRTGTGEMNAGPGKCIKDGKGKKHRAGIEQQLSVSSRRSRRAQPLRSAAAATAC